MAIEYIKKNLTTINNGVIAHGCNCQGKMGAGVALAIRNKWPTVYEQYLEMCNMHKTPSKSKLDVGLLGACQIVPLVDNGVTLLAVANCFTQEYYGRDGKRYADPAAIEESLWNAVYFAVANYAPFYMSRIGCNLGGLNWEADVEPIVARIANKYQTTIHVCDL